ncbi:hypothetical protein KDW_32540 [Dictyobacter vulcani]|uniref:Transcription initiation factor TFIIIB n=1 Tax=Dictyobacter vulcani TaxID=2607529 RepID=A0A5J4KPK2_9CHLR|nr:hypothetical protein [Dictyobacter vulcani]GER89092.1 hypothetical protein KDW_32540 [Dictyobacter vulcani]
MNETQPQPSLRPCPECGGERIQVKVVRPGIVVFTLPKIKKFISFPESTVLIPVVCKNCGYAAFYAADPSKLD